MSEQKFKKDLCKKLQPYGHVSMIESHETSTGFPDLDFCFTGVGGQLELKHQTLRKPMKIKPSQRRWFKQRTKARGNCWLLALFENKYGKHYILVHGRHIGKLTTNIQTWVDNSDWEWEGEIYIDELVVRLKKHYEFIG